MSAETPPPGPLHWLMVGDAPSGPFPPDQIFAKLAAGEVNWQTSACPLGESRWRPLAETCLAPTHCAPIPPAPAATSLPPAAANSLPWNPTTVAWMGLAFTPMWAGVMAAVNGRRLGVAQPAWVPLTIGFGFLALDCLVSLVVDRVWLDLLLYGGAVWLLWSVVFRPQGEAFARFAVTRATPTGRWAWPIVAGVPLALVTAWSFVVEPLRPLEPREVCEQFVKSSTVPEMTRYTTAKLRPALEALAKVGDDGTSSHFELTDEAAAPSDVGGYLVGWRLAFTDGGQAVRMEGVFHLVHWSGDWQIEDMFFTRVNGQFLEAWLSLATDYAQLLRSSAGPGRTSQRRTGADAPASAKRSPVDGIWTADFWRNPSGKRIGGLAVIAAAAAGWLRTQSARRKPTT